MTADSNSSPTYFRYWGKVGKDGSGYHLLPYHCLDVAAVGWILLDPQKPVCVGLSEQLSVKPKWLRKFFTFCLALHDVGKFSRSFQGLKTDLSPDLVKANASMPYSERHDSLGFSLWRCILSKKSENNEVLRWFNEIEPWIKIVTGHHGMPPKQSGFNPNNFFTEEDNEAAKDFMSDVSALLLKDFNFDQACTKRVKTISWQLAGITVLADWIGSNTEHFNYYGYDNKMDLKAYWETIALPSAQKAVSVMPEPATVRNFESINDLFSIIHQPTPLQGYAVNEPLNDGPQLFILEDVTGAGKTEAAIALTHRLLSAGLADGVYVALPTMATANAMYERLGKVYQRLYDQNSTPSLILAHGARDLTETFRESVALPGNKSNGAAYGKPTATEDEELSASAYCNAWLADNRKKALLADVGVGTIDQALLAVLPARHQSLRLLGLRRKVLLVDEVHAYDSYMQKLLDALLEAHARQGGSAILLSATLPWNMREQLVAAFYRGLRQDAPAIVSTDYPLATHAPASNDLEKDIDTREEVKRTVAVTRLDTEDGVFVQIQDAVNKGQCVCWIRNTVKAARETHAALSQSEWMDKNYLHLFHSRFAMIDRQRIENDVLKRFGDQSGHEDRKGHVLVATQVVEQSLDLDFDILITDLAPVDLIIQRAGRLCRHVRDADGNRIMGHNAKDQRGMPTIYVYSPDPTDDADENWLKDHQKGTQSVYPHIGQLWLTAKKLSYKEKFTMPEDARDLIEGIYSDMAEDEIPEILRIASNDAIARNQAQRSMASLNGLKIKKGYTRSSGEWDEEIRIPTRLAEEESVSMVLVKYRDGNLWPYAANSHHPWAMSVVKIPEWEWKQARGKISQEFQNMIEELKVEVKFLRWLEVFPLTEETQHYYNTANGWQPETGATP